MELDYFGLEQCKRMEIPVEHLDYQYIEECKNVNEMKNILLVLKSGKEGKYPKLEDKVEQVLLQLLPEKERIRVLHIKNGPSRKDVAEATLPLKDWTAEMRQKEKMLTKLETVSLPPVRGQVKCERLESKEKVNKSKETIGAYDFRSWEKYDVEKELDRLEKEEQDNQKMAKVSEEEREFRIKQRRKELSSLSSKVDLHKMSITARQVYAMQEKQKGNDCFRANETEEAVLYYTRSIAFYDQDAILYSNRALAQLRLKQFSLAEQDCTRAIELDHTFLKAWIRRGITRHRRGKYKEAIEDFEKVLELDNKNTVVEKLLHKTRQKYKEVEGEQFKKLNIVDSQDEEYPEHEEKDVPRIEIISETQHGSDFQSIPISSED